MSEFMQAWRGCWRGGRVILVFCTIERSEGMEFENDGVRSGKKCVILKTSLAVSVRAISSMGLVADNLLAPFTYRFACRARQLFILSASLCFVVSSWKFAVVP